MSDTEKEKDVSCFSVDGVVAEMVIEVEDNPKSGSEDFKDLSNSPDKNISSIDKADFHSQIENEILGDNTSKESEPPNIDESETPVNKSSEDEENNKLEVVETEKAETEETDKSVEEIEKIQSEEVDKSVEVTEKSQSEKVDKSIEEIDKSIEEIDKSTEDIDKSVEEVEKSKVEQTKKPEAKKKENKENLKILETKSNSKNSEIRNSDEKKSHNFVSKQVRKRKIKSESKMAPRESAVKKEDESRYPGRKRLANKWYSSEDLITSKTKKSNSVDDDSKGVKRRKLEIDSKEVKEIPKKLGKAGRPRKLSQNKESNVKSKEESKVKQESLEKEADTEDTKTKYSALRKLPFRKNKDVPDVPDLTPNVFLWNGVGEGVGCKLGDIPEIAENIKSARSIRALYRVIFFQWPTNGRDIVEPILEFNGFPFDKSSYEYTKRQSLMKVMLDATISNICETLDLRKGDKQTMINNILNFLLRPYAKIDPAQVRSLQPVVVLERLFLDDDFFNETSSEVKSKRGRGSNLSRKTKENVRSPVAPARTTRGTASRVEIVIEPVKSLETPKEKLKVNKSKPISPKPVGRKDAKPETSQTKDSRSKTLSSSKDSKSKPTSTVKDVKPETSQTNDSRSKTLSSSKDSKSKPTSTVKDVKTKAVPESKQTKFSPKEKVKFAAKNTVAKKRKMPWMKSYGSKRKRIAQKPTVAVSSKKDKKFSENESDEYEIEMTVDSGPDMDEDAETEDVDKSKTATDFKEENKTTPPKQDNKLKTAISTVTLSDSSETESAEETKLVTASRKSTDIAKSPLKLRALPLKRFPKVCESIQKANFSALQRLHILLFGSSDKPENLKSNILAFGGFNFLEGSDEWKQKHFLLSLLAQSNLREYLNLLCIPYSGDDQITMIEKLMKFLASPVEELLENKTQKTVETEVVKSELVNKSPTAVPVKGKVEAKKKAKKKDEKKTTVPPRQRKVLMSEEEARRLEASFAREQRALARDKASEKFPTINAKPPIQLQTTATPKTTLQLIGMTPIKPYPSTGVKPSPQSVRTTKISPQPVADPQQLNALLQTVYKRRALKAAGAVVSTPNKGEKTKLGDIENVKFLIVTSNLADLEMLHNLIFMQEASKSRLRKNILDFDGFGFNEDSPKYKERMDFLKRLGYDASKRISFLLGLCALQTNIPQQDLNELIMYFLMSPCKTKQVVPITEMPPIDEPPIAVNTTLPFEKTKYYQDLMKRYAPSTPKPPAEKRPAQTSTPKPNPVRQKARKSFPSRAKASPSPIKKVLLPPYNAPGVGKAAQQKMTLLNSVPAVPALSLPKTPINNTPPGLTLLNTPSGLALLNTQPTNQLKVPVVSTNSNVQILNQSSRAPAVDSAAKSAVNTIPTVSGILQNHPLLIPQVSNKSVQPQLHAAQSPLVPGAKMLVKTSTGYASAPQEFLVQQQTPDGHQKTFKLIRLPPNHPLASTVSKPPGQQTVQSPPVQQQLILTGAPLMTNPQTGFILMNSSSGLQTAVPNLSSILKSTSSVLANKTSTSVSKQSKSNSSAEEIVIPDDEASDEVPANSRAVNELEISKTSESSQPTDEDLFESIQEVILTSNFEDITLRNVIERVAAQFPDHDLTHRHNYMKECVKKIIIGT